MRDRKQYMKEYRILRMLRAMQRPFPDEDPDVVTARVEASMRARLLSERPEPAPIKESDDERFRRIAGHHALTPEQQRERLRHTTIYD